MCGAVQPHLLEDVFLPFLDPNHGIESEAFGLVTVKQCESLGAGVRFDAASVVLEELLLA